MTAAPAQSTEITASTGGLRQSLTHIWLIARVEHRRLYRKWLSDNRLMLIVTSVLTGLFILGASAGTGWWGHSFGTAVGTDGFAEQLPLVRLSVTAVALSILFLMTQMTISEYGELDDPTPVLTAIPYWEAVCGRMLINHILFIELAAIPILVMAIAFAIGAGSIVSAPITVGALLALVVFSSTVGFVIGQLIRLVIARSEFITKYKTVIGVIGFIAYFGAIASGVFDAVFTLDLSRLGETPLGWVADLGLVAVPTPVIGVTQPAIAAVTVVGGTGILTWGAIRISGVLLYTDPVQPATDDSLESEPPTATLDQSERLSESVFGGRISRPTLRIAQKNWRRAYRAPLKLQYAAYPLLGVGFQIGPLLNAGHVPEWLVLYIAVCGAWATGSAFALNPFGDEGAVLPLTLTSGVSGRTYLAGTVLSGVAPGVPITVVATVGLGVLSPLGAVEIAALAVFGGVLCAGASVLAAGIGTLYPKFEESRITRNRSAVTPSIMAFFLFTIGLLAIGVPGVIAQVPVVLHVLGGLGTALLGGFPDVIAQAPGFLTDLAGVIETTPGAPVIGAGLTALLAAGIAVLATRRVLRTFERYTIE